MKLVPIFTSLSAVSITPFVPSFFGLKGEIKLPKDSNKPMSEDYQREPELEERESSENAMQEAVQRIERAGGNKEQTGCFWLFEKSRSFEFFMCVNTTELSPLTLFHYARKEKGMSLKEKLNEVSEITYNGVASLMMTLKSGTTKSMPNHLRTSFAWLRKDSGNFIPSRHCNLTSNSNSSLKKYKLTCTLGEKGFSDDIDPEPPYKKAK